MPDLITTAHRYHDISTGHRVVGHENKCRHLHGHNYRIHFYCYAEDLDHLGRVIDFGVIKEKLCMWLENNWDHKFLAWNQDPLFKALIVDNSPYFSTKPEFRENIIMFEESIVWTDFNPTAENMAQHLMLEIGPFQLSGTGVTLMKVVIEETMKCAVTCEVSR